MEIKIDVSDFYLEDGDLESNLKAYVVREVTRTIWEQIKKEVKEKCETTVIHEVDRTLSTRMAAFTEECLADPELKVKGKTIKEYLQDKYVNQSGWGSPAETLDKIAKQCGIEMKQRYDIVFATQIVRRLHDNGLLKEGAEKILLDT